MKKQTLPSPAHREHREEHMQSRVTAVIEAAECRPVLVEVIPVWLKPMATDSDEARKARERHQDEQRHREEVEKRRKPKLLSESHFADGTGKGGRNSCDTPDDG